MIIGSKIKKMINNKNDKIIYCKYIQHIQFINIYVVWSEGEENPTYEVIPSFTPSQNTQKDTTQYMDNTRRHKY